MTPLLPNLPPPLTPDQIPTLFARIQADANFNAYITLQTPDALRSSLENNPAACALHGFCFAVKDNLDVAGLPTTAACPPFRYLPKRCNPVVQALLDAGAVCLGKTNLDQFATGLVGTRSPYGIVPNPHNPAFIAGGSSSGSAVAVALNHVHFALATDTAGSGRVPAALNGIIGLKPTRGLLSTRGLVPACRSLDCISFFTKSLPLARKLLALTTAYDPLDPFSRPQPNPLPPTPPPPWNIGFVPPEKLFWDGDASSQAAYAQALQLWQNLGHRLQSINPQPLFRAGKLLYHGPWVAERATYILPFLKKHFPKNPQAFDPTVRSILLNANRFSAIQTFRALHQLQSLQRQTQSLWQKIHFLCLPTIPTSYTIEQVLAEPLRLNFQLGTYTQFVNLLDLCAITIPYGKTKDQIPTGPSLIAPAFQENLLLDAAEAFLSAAQPPFPSHTLLAVCGAHLRGQPLHPQLLQLGATYLCTTTTAPAYRLFALPNTSPPKPGLLHCPTQGTSIEVEVYSIPTPNLGILLASTPPPLSLGNLSLADGSTVKGFLCEAAATSHATDISHLQSWRNYLHWHK